MTSGESKRVNTAESSKPRIVIVGGGVAGLLVATRLGQQLGRTRAQVTLVDRSWTHVWKPMLHTFAAGTWNMHQQQVRYLLHARTHHFGYVPGRLDAIDREAKRVRLAPMHDASEAIADARDLEYDVLILAFGSRANDFATPGVAEHCHSSTARIKPTRSVRACARTSYAACFAIGISTSRLSAAALPASSSPRN